MSLSGARPETSKWQLMLGNASGENHLAHQVSCSESASWRLTDEASQRATEEGTNRKALSTVVPGPGCQAITGSGTT